MMIEFTLDGRSVRVDWDGSRRSCATLTDLTHGVNREITFPAGFAPYAALSALGTTHGDALVKAQRQLVNCLDLVSKPSCL